jgi:peptide/nickel transport system substrate-binding protein
VAESHEISEDGRTYTFSIRDDVLFHNGNPVTVEDIIWSLDRGGIGGAKEAPDDKTVVIQLEEPVGEFLASLTCAILPQGYEDQAKNPIGTGPFMFVGRQIGDSVSLQRFDEYWGEKPAMKDITYKIFESGDALVLAIQSGAIDLCAHLTATQAAQLGSDYEILNGTMNLVQALYLNNDVKPLDDIRVRQALCYAVDKEAVIDLATDGTGVALGSSMYPAFKKYFDDSLTNYYTLDIEKAKELLTQAGYPEGFDLTVTVPSNYTPHVDTAQVLEEQLKAINVRVSIELVDWNTWVSRAYTNREFQSTLVGVDASSMTARAMLERFTSEHGKNFINYSNSDYDRLFQEAQSTFDDEKQTQIYKAMEKNLTENAANVYIQDLGDLVALRSDLTGYEFYPIYVMDLSGIRAK